MKDVLRMLIGGVLLALLIGGAAGAQVLREKSIVGYAQAMADDDDAEAGRQANAAKEAHDLLTQLGVPPAF